MPSGLLSFLLLLLVDNLLLSLFALLSLLAHWVMNSRLVLHTLMAVSP
jgi:hypothetical protein